MIKNYYRGKITTLQLNNSWILNSHSEIHILHCIYRLVTMTLNPIWASFSAITNAASLVSNWPTLTR